jgi:uncharacterized phage infection (PIP) family protein YhgE
MNIESIKMVGAILGGVTGVIALIIAAMTYNTGTIKKITTLEEHVATLERRFTSGAEGNIVDPLNDLKKGLSEAKQTADKASSTANDAKNLATAAKDTATAAKDTATAAKDTATAARDTANSALTKANCLNSKINDTSAAAFRALDGTAMNNKNYFQIVAMCR